MTLTQGTGACTGSFELLDVIRNDLSIYHY
jgi:hypothetical protein